MASNVANCGGLLIDGSTIVVDSVTKAIKVGGDNIVVTPAVAQADSEATTVELLLADFNTLLANLRTAGFIATE